MPPCIALSGPSGIGKSTLANELQACLAQNGVTVTVIHQDTYFHGKKPASYWTQAPKESPDTIDMAALRAAAAAAVDDASRQLVRPTDRDTSMPPLLTAMCEYSDLVRSMTTAPNRAEALKVEGAKASRRGAGQDLRFRIFGPSDESPGVSVVRCGLARALNRGPDFGPLSPSPGSPARAASTDSAADRARRIGRCR